MQDVAAISLCQEHSDRKVFVSDWISNESGKVRPSVFVKVADCRFGLDEPVIGVLLAERFQCLGRNG